MENTAKIADVITSLDPTGLAAELVQAKGGTLSAAEARKAVEALYATDPATAASVREAFLAWPPERQSEAIGALAGGDCAARRTWSRLLCGIVENADGKPALV